MTCQLCRRETEPGEPLCSQCEPKASRVADVDAMAATRYHCHKCGQIVGKDGYRDDMGESSLCAMHLAELNAKLDYAANAFFGDNPADQPKG